MLRHCRARAVGCTLLLGVISLTGCQTPPRDAGFGQVGQVVAQRTGQKVAWRGHTTAAAAADAQVRQMLGHPLTQQQAVALALINNRRLQATYEDLGIARAQLVQAGLIPNPLATLDVRWPESGSEVTWEFQAAAQLVDLLTLPQRQELAQAQFLRTRLEVTQAVFNLIAQVRQAYFDLQAAQQLLEMRQSVLEAAAASRDLSDKMHQAGNITNLAWSQESAAYEDAYAARQQAQLAVAQAHDQLAVLLGLSGAPARQLRVPGRLADLPARTVQPRGLEARALAQRTDLAAARQEILVAQRRAGLAGAGIWSDLAIGIHHEHDASGESATGPTLTFPIPLFDQGQARRQGAQAQLAQARFRYAALATEIQGQVRQAYARMAAARQQAQRLERIVLPLKQKIVDEAQRQYNAMALSAFQLLLARRDEIVTGARYIGQLHDYWSARAQLENAVGGALPPMPASTQPAAQPAPPPPATRPSMPSMPGMDGMPAKKSTPSMPRDTP